MKEIAASLLLWINANSAYDYDGMPPRIVTTDPESLVYLILGEIPIIPERARTGIKGIYDIETRTIWLRHDFDSASYGDRGHLVHELVHFLQHRRLGDEGMSCGRQLELQAQQIQNRYLRQHGLTPRRLMARLVGQSSACGDAATPAAE